MDVVSVGGRGAVSVCHRNRRDPARHISPNWSGACAIFTGALTEGRWVRGVRSVCGGMD
jgi:hypothetical protein